MPDFRDPWCPECRRSGAYCTKAFHRWIERPPQARGLRARGREAALTVPCVLCGVPTGRPCRTTRGYRAGGRTAPHRARVRDALADALGA